MLEWEDRDGKVFTCEGCWDYVTGPAQAGELDTAVPRDIANDGKLPQDFLQVCELARFFNRTSTLTDF